MFALNTLTLLCIAKAIRTFGFGAISVVLAIFLAEKGFSSVSVGFIFSATLIEDAVVTTLVSLLANQIGMRRVLLASSFLVVMCGLALCLDLPSWLVACAAIFGIVSPAGYEGGPFSPVEQTIISQSEKAERLTGAFSWYNLTGFAGAALGALFAGFFSEYARASHCPFPYETLFFSYAVGGMFLALIYMMIKIPTLSELVSTPAGPPALFASLKQSRGKVFRFSALQGLDAFGGGFVAQSLIAYWFFIRYHAGPEFTGPIFFWANILAAVSFTTAPLFVNRFGLLKTMVFSHLPCSLALCLMPLMPDCSSAGILILARSLFSSMDIPVRQAYTMLLVHPDERPASAGITSAARAICQGISPAFASLVSGGAGALIGLPFVFAGLAKSAYDIGLYWSFRGVALPGQAAPEAAPAAAINNNALNCAESEAPRAVVLTR